MAKYVLRHGGLSLGKDAVAPGVALLPAEPGKPPTVVEMTEAEAEKINAGHARQLLEGSKGHPAPLQLLSEYEAEIEADAARADVLARVKSRGMSVPQSFEALDSQMRTVEAQFDARSEQLTKEAAALQKLNEESQEKISKAHSELEKKWKELDAREAALAAQARKFEEAAKESDAKDEKPKGEKQSKGGKS